MPVEESCKKLLHAYYCSAPTGNFLSDQKCHVINLSKRVADCDFHFSVNGGIIEWCTKTKFQGFYFAHSSGFCIMLSILGENVLTG